MDITALHIPVFREVCQIARLPALQCGRPNVRNWAGECQATQHGDHRTDGPSCKGQKAALSGRSAFSKVTLEADRKRHAIDDKVCANGRTSEIGQC